MRGHSEHHGHCDSRHEFWGAGRHHRRGKFGGGFGYGGRHGGRGGMDPDDLRAGRMLAQGDVRLLALALIAEAPRHGYEIIKLVEERTADWYSPSPGIVYPTLTYLEEAGYVTAAAEGSKKLYTITDAGRSYLAENRDIADSILERLTTLGEKISRWRRHSRGERSRDLPPLVETALDHLREVVRKRLDADADTEASLVEVIAAAAADLNRK
jgi:DNA-binding PadR family transcriptional regulator